jgi:hypothetical protein
LSAEFIYYDDQVQAGEGLASTTVRVQVQGLLNPSDIMTLSRASLGILANSAKRGGDSSKAHQMIAGL